MPLPSELAFAVDELKSDIPQRDLVRAVAELSSQYRTKQRTRPQLTTAHRAAYLMVRLPATYAVISRVFLEAKLRIPELQIDSMLDLGAGPGTAMWAAAAQFPNLSRVTLIEDSPEWKWIGQRISSKSVNPVIRSADWRTGSITDELPGVSFDLVTCSYVINELSASERVKVALAAWQTAGKLLVIIEPGTPEGFANIRTVRHELIAAGAYVAAPCPHANTCPIGPGNWCHFAERLERTSEHRRAKGAESGYEDEKYSYVIFTREQVELPAARILRHPLKHSGHLALELCTPEGLKQETISRKQGEVYKWARKAEWGETL